MGGQISRRTLLRTKTSSSSSTLHSETRSSSPMSHSSNELSPLVERVRHEFKQLESAHGSLRKGSVDTDSFSVAINNTQRNRYTDVLPYDATRVVLGSGVENDYINASWVKMPHRTYIATQGPLESTTAHFWQMVSENKVHVVATLAGQGECKPRVVRATAQQLPPKCFQYWPEQEEGAVVFEHGAVSVTVQTVETRTFDDYILRKIVLNGDDGQVVWQYHYLKWQDHGVPEASLSDFVSEVNQSAGDNALVLVHCSAGIGRTGTYIAIDELTASDTIGDGDIVNVVQRMRDQRAGMVQTLQQYAYIYSETVC